MSLKPIIFIAPEALGTSPQFLEECIKYDNCFYTNITQWTRRDIQIIDYACQFSFERATSRSFENNLIKIYQKFLQSGRSTIDLRAQQKCMLQDFNRFSVFYYLYS